MIDSLRLWARYNQATDQTLARLLTDLGSTAYTQERNTYYKSLAGLHHHVVVVMKYYLGLVRQHSGERFFVSPLTEPTFTVAIGDLGAVSEAMAGYDALLVAFAEAHTDADLAGPKTKVTFRSGKSYLLSVTDILTQYMNHATHHRGQVSQILDELGVENDLGRLLDFAEEAPDE